MYEPLSFCKIRGQSTTHLSCVLVIIHVDLAEEILDFVDPSLHFVSEDGKQVTHQVRGHYQDEYGDMEGTNRMCCYYIPCQHVSATIWPCGYMVVEIKTWVPGCFSTGQF